MIDTVGGAKHLWDSYRVPRRGGRLVWLGSAAVEIQGLRAGAFSMATTSLLRLLPDSRRVPRCPTMASFAKQHNDWYQDTLGGLLGALAGGDLEPVVGARIPLADAARAHALLETGQHTGKIVLVPNSWDGRGVDEAAGET